MEQSARDSADDLGVVVDERDTEVVDGADKLLVVSGIGLDLGGVLAEPVRAAWLDIPEYGDFRYLPDPLPDTVRLPEHGRRGIRWSRRRLGPLRRHESLSL
ncbi:hypothetical protein ABZ467_33990 [Streptomyces sp. NPDC005727]|uniref:hypothetical protein n=1 Tax=Streptomyces sp. NPDC005727 TaxID=3157053 RepID=UPI0033FBC93D